MSDKEQGKSGSEKKPSRKLVRILIVVGIGIPVLVELLTLLNLINVQFFETEKAAKEHNDTRIEQTMYSEGDTLFVEDGTAVVLREFKINVSARQWRFEITLAHSNGTGERLPNLKLDSLSLQSGEVVRRQQSGEWENGSAGSRFFHTEWELPAGDIPEMLFLSYQRTISGDSMAVHRKRIPVQNIPVRYNRENE